MRRQRAWKLHRRGWPHALIAEALGVTEGAISRWIGVASRDGSKALRAKSRLGQSARLSKLQLQKLPSLLDKGAEAYGFLGAVWTCRRISEVIQREFCVQYHPSHVSRLLHQLEWSYQKPLLRATQRDEAIIADWLSNRWPEIKKKPTNKGVVSSSSMNQVST